MRVQFVRCYFSVATFLAAAVCVCVLLGRPALAVSTPPQSLVAQGNYTTIQFRDGPAAGLPAGETYSAPVSSLVANSLGEISFGVGSTEGRGVWTDTTTGVMRLAAINNQPAPHDPTQRLDLSGTVAFQTFLTDAGATYFESDLEGGRSGSEGVYRETYTGGLESILTTDDVLPVMLAGERIDRLYLHNVSRGGPYVVEATVRNEASNDFLYRTLLKGSDAGPLSEIVRIGDSALGLDSNETVAILPHSYPAQINASGNALIPVGLSGPEVDSTNDFALLYEGTSGLQVMLREGDLLGARSRLTNIGNFQLNDQNHLYFEGSLNNSTERSLYRIDESGSIMSRLSRNTLVSGLPPGVSIDRFGFQVNNLGEIVSSVRLAGSSVTEDNDDALLKIDADGSARLLLREGQAVPGFDAVTYGTFPVGSTFFGADISDDGHIYFTSVLEDGGLGEVNANTNIALWDISPEGEQTMLIRKFDDLHFSDSILHEANNVIVQVPNLNSQSSGYANGGIAAIETFWGSVLVPARPIPEPGTAVLLAAGLVFTGVTRRKLNQPRR